MNQYRRQAGVWIRGEGDTPSRSPEIVEHDYKDREPDCPICLDTGQMNGSDLPCACFYDRPLPEGYVDPPKPQSLAERIGRLQREHGEMKALLLKVVAINMKLSIEREARDLLNRIEARKGHGG